MAQKRETNYPKQQQSTQFQLKICTIKTPTPKVTSDSFFFFFFFAAAAAATCCHHPPPRLAAAAARLL
jgi:hypothetical protein